MKLTVANITIIKPTYSLKSKPPTGQRSHTETLFKTHTHKSEPNYFILQVRAKQFLNYLT